MKNTLTNLSSVLPIFILTALISVGCNSIQVSSDYDTKADFKAYKTYSFAQSINDLRLNSDNKEIMKNAIINEMKARGYQQSNSVNPDLWIELFMKYNQSIRTVTTNDDVFGIRLYPYGIDFSATNIDYHSFSVGTLFIDVVDGNKNLMVWQGRVSTQTRLDQSDLTNEKLINDAIKKVYKYFPSNAH